MKKQRMRFTTTSAKKRKIQLTILPHPFSLKVRGHSHDSRH